MCSEAGRGRRGWAYAALFPALALLVLAPLLASFAPLFSGGFLRTLSRAFADRRFISSFGFGLAEAGGSALVAALVGLPGAYLLARRRFPGRRLLSALSAVPFCVPPLIIAIGFVLYYGREGFLNRAAMALFGLAEPPLTFLYSFGGIVMTHGFYNFPVVMSLVGDAWATVPASHEDAARLLGASKARVFLTVTLPSIAPALGAALSLVFLMCFYSFVIVLLFGGVGVGTPEVELYRAARFELDRPLASAFALLETAVAMGVLALYAFLESRAGAARRESAPRAPAKGFATGTGASLALLYGLFVLVAFLGPLASIVYESFLVRGPSRTGGALGLGTYAALFSRRGFLSAAFNTVLVGAGSALMAAFVGFSFSLALKRARSGFVARVLPLLPLAISSVVLAYGWSSLFGKASPLTLMAVQAVSAYPFVLRSIQGSVGLSDERYAEAALTLGSSRLGSILRVRLPMALPAVASGAALAFAMSSGDANAIIAAPVAGFDTLALMLYRLAGSYRLPEACAAAVTLALLTGFVFFMKGARRGVA